MISRRAKYRLLVFIILAAIALFNSCKVASPTESKKAPFIPPPVNTYRPPGAPAYLKAKATSLSTIEIDWIDTSRIANWFVIEREITPDTLWQIIDSTSGLITVYNDAGLLCGNTYNYRVYADNNIGRSFYSNIAFATTPFDSVGKQKSGFYNDLYGTAFFDNSTGLIVGTAGLILKTTDAGVSWDSVQSGTAQNLAFISVHGTTGITVGASGTILRTDDEGASWSPQASGTKSTLNSIAYLGSNSWVAVGDGGKILRTTDGGSLWLQATSGVGTNLYSVSFSSSNIGVVSGSQGTILWTTDGGLDWVKQNSAGAGALFSVAMVNPTTATAVGDNGTIIHTTNGGASWTVIPSGVYNWLYTVSFVDSNKGFAAGAYGLLIHTNDGGATWVQQSLNIPNQMLCVYSHRGFDVTIVGIFGAIFRIFSCN